MAGQPRTRELRATSAAATRPTGPPRAIVYTVLERAGAAGLPFEDAWGLAVPLALTGAGGEDQARDMLGDSNASGTTGVSSTHARVRRPSSRTREPPACSTAQPAGGAAGDAPEIRSNPRCPGEMADFSSWTSRKVRLSLR